MASHRERTKGGKRRHNESTHSWKVAGKMKSIGSGLLKTTPNGLNCLVLTGLLTALYGLLPVWAAERVLLKYRGFSRTVAVADLATLAASGEAPENLASLLEASGQQPEQLRSLLTNSLSASPVVLDKALNSRPGEWMLAQLGTAIHPVTGEASQQALRAAIILSAADDNTLTLLEILENYPTPEVVLEGDQIQRAYNRLEAFLTPLSIFL